MTRLSSFSERTLISISTLDSSSLCRLFICSNSSNFLAKSVSNCLFSSSSSWFSRKTKSSLARDILARSPNLLRSCGLIDCTTEDKVFTLSVIPSPLQTFSNRRKNLLVHWRGIAIDQSSERHLSSVSAVARDFAASALRAADLAVLESSLDFSATAVRCPRSCPLCSARLPGEPSPLQFLE